MNDRKSRAQGFLAIWSDIAAGDETDYLHWLTREHMAERLAVDGFLSARVWRAVEPGARRYFIHYELSSAEVVSSPAYLERLADPTPWSQRIMPRLGNFARGGGRVVARAGSGTGGVRAAIRLHEPPAVDADGLVASLAVADRVTGAALLLTDQERTSIPTAEKAMRTADGSFSGLLLVDALDEAAASAAVEMAGRDADGAIYRLAFALQGG